MNPDDPEEVRRRRLARLNASPPSTDGQAPPPVDGGDAPSRARRRRRMSSGSSGFIVLCLLNGQMVPWALERPLSCCGPWSSLLHSLTHREIRLPAVLSAAPSCCAGLQRWPGGANRCSERPHVHRALSKEEARAAASSSKTLASGRHRSVHRLLSRDRPQCEGSGIT